MKTIFIHGYNFDLANGDDPESQYTYWRNFVDGEIIPFKWQSTISLFDAWTRGHWNTYHWAWDEAIRQGKNVAEILQTNDPCNIVCHSLGSRVAYTAMAMVPNKVHKILTFNGADTVEHARACMNVVDGPEVYCVSTREDDVLGRVGRMFTPKLGLERVVGYDGMPQPHPKNWFQIDIGKSGDGEGYGDHSWSFKNSKLWPQWREILAD